MQYKVKAAIIFKGDRVEPGGVIDISAEQAIQLGAAIAPVVTEVIPEPVAEKDIADMSLAELKSKAEELGLDTKGSKASLVERITLHAEGKEA